MTALGLLGPVVLTACGFGLLVLLRVFEEQPFGTRLAFSYLAGVTWIGLVATTLSHIGQIALRRTALLPVVLIPILAALAVARVRGPHVARRTPPKAETSPSRWSVWTLPVLLGSLVFAGLLLEGIGRPVSDWDGRAIWLSHARNIRGERSVDATILRDGRYAVNHPRYPPLLPVVTVATQEVFGLGDDDRLIRPLYAAFFPVLLLLVAHAARRAGRLVAALMVTVVATLPQLSFDPNGGAASAYSDLPLACFFGAGLLLLIEPGSTVAEGVLAGLLLGGAVATKTEGLGLAAIALLGAGIARALRKDRSGSGRDIKALLPAPLGILLVTLLLASWRAGIQDRLSVDYLGPLNPANLASGLHRLPTIASAIFRSMSTPAQWEYFWLAFPVLLVLGWRGVVRRDVLPWLLVILLAACIPLLGYLVAPFDPSWIVETTWSRFLVQIAVPLFAVAAGALAALLPAGPAIERRIAIVGTALGVILIGLLGRRILAMSPSMRVARHLNLTTCPQGDVSNGRTDESLAASIDAPSESQEVTGPLLVSGWAQEEGGPSEIGAILIDERRRPCRSFCRIPRPDVETVLPRLGNCDLAGYQMQLPFEPGDGGPHRIRVQIRSYDGRIRWLQRPFSWKPG